ncbi:MAG: hypothetical protein NVS1B13_08010 [Flavisolibacter sp.]
MKANLDEIALFVCGRWYTENGKTMYEFEPADADYLGNTLITSLAQNTQEKATYFLTADNSKVYIIIGETEYTIEELDRYQLVYQNDRINEVLVRSLHKG